MTKAEKQTMKNLINYKPVEVVKDKFAYDRLVKFYRGVFKGFIQHEFEKTPVNFRKGR